MKRSWSSKILLASMVGLLAMPALAEDPYEDESASASERKFTIHGEVRSRWEYLSNYTDLLDHDDDSDLDDDANFYPYRARIAARGTFTDDIIGHIEIQNSGIFGNEGPVRSGTSPTDQTDFNIDDSETVLYQAFVDLRNIGGSHWSVRVGRQEHTLGNELHMGDADFYNGVSFDGLRGMWDGERFNLGVFHYIVDEEDIDGTSAGLNVPTDDSDVTFSGVTADWMFGDDNHLEPYLLFLRDGDYSGSGGKVYTLGALYRQPVDSREMAEDNPFDWSVEFAWQTGDFAPNGPPPPTGDLDISAYIAEGWFGYNFTHGDSARSRVHVGALIASGDDDGLDDEFSAYIPLFPDEHAMNRLGDLDLFGGFNVVSDLTDGGPTGAISNVTDLNGGYEFWANDDRHYFSASLHWLSLTEELAPDGDDSLGTELDLLYRFRYSDHVSLEGAVAHLSPGDALDAITDATDIGPGPEADAIMRAWAQLRLRW